MRSEFLFKLLDGVGPVDRLGRLVVIGDVLAESGFESSGRDKVIGLQTFALQQTEPNFDLIEPGGVGRQPIHLEAQPSITGLFLLMEPAFELFGCMRGSVIENEGHCLHSPPQRFGNELLVHKSLEIDKTFALTTGPIDFAISDGESRKQMAGTPTMIAGFVQQRLA